MQLATCMPVYTPCVCSGGGNVSEAGYCSDVNFTSIVVKVLDVCQCTSLTQNCRLQLLFKLDRIEGVVKVVSPQDKGRYCQRLPEGEPRHSMCMCVYVHRWRVVCVCGGGGGDLQCIYMG